MKAIEYVNSMPRLALATILGQFSKKGYLTKAGFIRLKDVPDPKILADDWLIIRTKFCGICGSDHKQVFLDGNYDNPMTAIISWPQILGHEAVGYVEKVGSKVKDLKVGDRVALNPWLSCLPREINPPCEMCAQGKNTLCKNFTKGLLAPGIHTGNSKDATGGFAELVPAHETMAIKIPDYVTWDQAILSDPFSVAFHSILKVKLRPGNICAVYGCGNLGLLTIHILKRIFRDIKVIAIARFEHQAEMAKTMGADYVIKSSPPNRVIEEIAKITAAEILYLTKEKPWLIEGVDYLFDTVASPQTLEVGLRITKARVLDLKTNEELAGSIIVTGVANPKRFEWTPWYFKNIHLIGSNAFAIETFEGRTEHAYYHYYRFLKEKRVDPSPIISHKFKLEEYQKAFYVAHQQAKYRSMKIAFQFDIKDPKLISSKDEAEEGQK